MVYCLGEKLLQFMMPMAVMLCLWSFESLFWSSIVSRMNIFPFDLWIWPSSLSFFPWSLKTFFQYLLPWRNFFCFWSGHRNQFFQINNAFLSIINRANWSLHSAFSYLTISGIFHRLELEVCDQNEKSTKLC